MDPYTPNYWKNNKYHYATNEAYSGLSAASASVSASASGFGSGSNGFVEKVRSPTVSGSRISGAIPYQMSHDWQVTSGCHSSCMTNSKGIQAVVNKRTGIKNIQLCSHVIKVSSDFHKC